jgi:hypothetical protein
MLWRWRPSLLSDLAGAIEEDFGAVFSIPRSVYHNQFLSKSTGEGPWLQGSSQLKIFFFVSCWLIWAQDFRKNLDEKYGGILLL